MYSATLRFIEELRFLLKAVNLFMIQQKRAAQKFQLQFFFAFLLIISLLSCKKGEKLDNLHPETQLVFEEINLSGENRLNSQVRLSWFGTDSDGYIVGYEYSLDNQNWFYTQTQDSTFVFPLEQGKDTTDIDFYIRSIDNNDLVDPTPAYLRIPLKNTAPEVQFISATQPNDTNHLAFTFSWIATDLDGDQSITNAYLKFNSGNWFEIPLNANIISIVPQNPEANGATNARLFYNGNFDANLIDGFNLNGNNTMYLKVVDFAGSESIEDTSNTFFVRGKTAGNPLLFISGQDFSTTQTYKDLLTGFNYDFIDYSLAENQPKFWDQTFALIIENYSHLFIHSDANIFVNPLNQRSDLLLEFMAPALQRYFNNQGKALVTTSFTTTSSIEGISEVFPIDSISTSKGQARLDADSGLVPINNATWPTVNPTFLLSGVSPFHPTSDAVPIYRGQLIKSGNWVGPNTVGARRSIAGIGTNQIFFSVQIHQFNKDVSAQKQLMQNLLNELGL